MARTVSRAGENGESTPVNVPSFDGHIEEHKASPQDIVAAKSPIPNSFKGVEGITTAGWIENLMDATTNFSSPKGSFKLLANGIHGSVQAIDEAIQKDPFVLRAVQRGRIQFLTDEQANARVNELVDEETAHGHSHDHLDHLMESLGPNASENNGMYKPGVPDEAEPSGPSLTPAQIWAKSESKPESPKNYRAHVHQEASSTTEFTL